MAFDKHTLFSVALLIAAFSLGFVVSALVVSPSWECSSCVGEGEIVSVVSQEYFDAVLKEIEGAEESVYVVIFSMKAYSSNNSVQQLQDALIGAKKRGVDVRVILDQSNWGGRITSTTENNQEAKGYLEAGGIEVKFDSLKETTHVKILVIDGRVLIIGSTNWTYSALERNNEANVIIKDSEIVEFYENYFEYLWKKY